MIVLIHILLALSSIILATSSLVISSKKTLLGAYGAIGLTLASGVYLSILNPAKLAQTCLSGITYIALVTVITIFARKRIRSI
jgi:CDP-diglyceride synthetase